MEISKEYFDKKLSGLATKADLELLATKADLEPLATKADLQTTETRLIKRIDDAQEELAQMTKRGFDEVYRRLDLRTEVSELQHQMEEVRQELHLA